MAAFRAIAGDGALRAIAGSALILGVVNACAYPYLSLIAVSRIGVSDLQLALILGLASGVAVSASVLFGVLADQFGRRRTIALVTVASTVLGVALVPVAPVPAVMALAHGILFPIGTSIFGQIFALNNLASQNHPAARESIQASIRALMSAGFLLTLLFWTWGLGTAGLPVMSVYPAAALAGLVLFALIWFQWPRAGAEPWVERPSGLALRPALAELARPAIAARLVCLGAIGGLPMLYIILTPLLFAQSPGRQLSDVALMVGLVAGFEVPFMLALPRLARRFSRQVLIAAGAGLYAVFVVLLALWSGTTHLVWVLPALAGMAAAPLLTLPISYWQDLMAGRPGTAAALMALQKLAGDLISASVFGIGTMIGGYGTVALIGGAVALCGGIGLILLDRRGLSATVSPVPPPRPG